MKYNTRPQAILLLADGTIFYGKSIGISGKTFGEVCFNTGMKVIRKYLPIHLILVKLW
jgi:carbamoyl-phosphate synthase small subunit